MTTAPASPVVLITGATGGLGRVAAAAFAADGARLGLGGTDRGRLEALAADLGLSDEAWAPVVADLRDARAATAAITALDARFGRVDVLVHLVGGWAGGTAMADLEPRVLEAMLGQHVWSTFHTARVVVPGMVARGWGRIVAVTATATAAPGPRAAAYLAAKSGQEALLRSLARDVAANGVTVNLIAVKAIGPADGADGGRPATTAGSTAPHDIVSTMRFLVSDAAASVTGQRIGMDGRG